jgi:sec-independent protein translocase protein TatC
MNPWVFYLIELRRRLLRFSLFTVICFTGLSLFSRPLYNVLALPLMKQLTNGQHLIATSIAAPFFVPLKFAFFCSLFLSIPYGLWQFWQFIAPGLYQHEKRLGRFILGSSIALFYGGVAFVYGVVFPMIFRFMQFAVPDSVTLLPDMATYLEFCTQLALAFGFAFEVPMVIVILIRLRIVTIEQCRAFRPYFIVSAFIIGMLLTPPDVISQCMLAIPLCMLFECGILLGRYWISTSKLAK